MSAATLEGIRSGLKTRLATIAGLNVYPAEPDAIYTPAALVGYDPGAKLVDYDVAMGEQTSCYHLSLQVLVQEAASLVDAQTALDPYIDPMGGKSIVTAIYGDRTLSGGCQDVRVVAARRAGYYNWGGVQYFGCEFLLEVLA